MDNAKLLSPDDVPSLSVGAQIELLVGGTWVLYVRVPSVHEMHAGRTDINAQRWQGYRLALGGGAELSSITDGADVAQRAAQGKARISQVTDLALASAIAADQDAVRDLVAKYYST